MQPTSAIHFFGGASCFGADPIHFVHEPLGDTSDEFHTNWDTVRLVLGAIERPLTRADICKIWPPGLARPHDATLRRWLDRAEDLGLPVRQGRGTKNEPYRSGLALSS